MWRNRCEEKQRILEDLPRSLCRDFKGPSGNGNCFACFPGGRSPRLKVWAVSAGDGHSRAKMQRVPTP